MIPNADEWTIIFSKTSTSWGSLTYDQAEDALRIAVKPEPAGMHNALTYSFDQLQPDSAVVEWEWEKITVPFKVSVNVHDTVLASLKKQLRNLSQYTWMSWDDAANYLLMEKVALDDALNYANKSIENEDRYDNEITSRKFWQRSTARARLRRHRRRLWISPTHSRFTCMLASCRARSEAKKRLQSSAKTQRNIPISGLCIPSWHGCTARSANLTARRRNEAGDGSGSRQPEELSGWVGETTGGQAGHKPVATDGRRGNSPPCVAVPRILCGQEIGMNIKHIRAYLMVCCLVAVLQPFQGLAPQNSGATKASVQQSRAEHNGQHDFDFEIGTWKIRLKRLDHRLVGSTNWVEFDGTSVTRKVWDDRAALEEFETDSPAGGHIEGLTLRLYDPQTHQWSLYWATSKSGTMGPPTIGEFKNGRGEFFDTEPSGPNGRAILVRFVWSDITPNSAHFAWQPGYCQIAPARMRSAPRRRSCPSMISRSSAQSSTYSAQYGHDLRSGPGDGQMRDLGFQSGGTRGRESWEAREAGCYCGQELLRPDTPSRSSVTFFAPGDRCNFEGKSERAAARDNSGMAAIILSPGTLRGNCSGWRIGDTLLQTRGMTELIGAKFDLVVIGTGVAGTTVASKCASAGWKVAIADSRPFGDTCALRGCEPEESVGWHR